jgi:hypothetical protein
VVWVWHQRTAVGCATGVEASKPGTVWKEGRLLVMAGNGEVEVEAPAS